MWGRRHQYVNLSFLGIFTFTAPYLPWVLLAFSGACWLRWAAGAPRARNPAAAGLGLSCPAIHPRLIPPMRPSPRAVMLGSSPLVDLLGMVAGHAYYFLEDVYPRMTGRRLLRTPAAVRALFPADAIAAPRVAPVPAPAPAFGGADGGAGGAAAPAAQHGGPAGDGGDGEWLHED